MQAALLYLPYWPNINWLRHYLACETVYIEGGENFIKSTYRNRCEIAGSNGKMALTIPLAGGRDHHQLYRETRISYANSWQHSHWKSIVSAYGSAPFFSFYAPKFEAFYLKEYELLFDFNLNLLNAMLQAIKIDKTYTLTNTFEKQPATMLDYRGGKPGQIPVMQNLPRYYQTFADRHGFLPNLSILDLIFNEGPATKKYLLNLV